MVLYRWEIEEDAATGALSDFQHKGKQLAAQMKGSSPASI